MDPLSEALQAVKVRGAVFMTMRCGAPWSVLTDEAPLRRAMPQVEHMIDFHYVQTGECHARTASSVQGIRVHAGEVLVVAQGGAHTLASDPQLAPVPIESLLPPKGQSPLTELVCGGAGDETLLVCGLLACDPRLCRPLLQALPPLMAVPLRSDPSGDWIDVTVRQSLVEVNSGRAGAGAVLARLAELLFVEALRRHVESLGSEQPGWLGALRDTNVGRALALLHREPGRDWTVDALARDAGCSRSVLAERFTHYLGLPPMRYLTRWRLAVAASALRSQDGARLARVAEDVGYASETAFNRAFKREFGHSPQRWRRQFAR